MKYITNEDSLGNKFAIPVSAITGVELIKSNDAAKVKIYTNCIGCRVLDTTDNYNIDNPEKYYNQIVEMIAES